MDVNEFRLPPEFFAQRQAVRKAQRFQSEKEMQDWLQQQFARLSPKIKAYRSVETLDMFSKGGAIDFVLVGELDGQPFSIAVECKKDCGISRNMAEGVHQAHHYREYSILTDKRIPDEIRYFSPNLSFAGVLVEGDHLHDQRMMGMEILMLKFGVGFVHYTPRYDEIDLRMGEVHLLRIRGGTATWHTSAANYLFGSRKRAGTRRDNKTLADNYFEFLQ